MQAILKKKLVQLVGSIETDPSCSNVLNRKESLESYSIKSFDQQHHRQTPLHMEPLSSNSRLQKASRKFVRKAPPLANQQQTSNNGSRSTIESRRIIPIQNLKSKPKLPPIDGTKFEQITPSIEQENTNPNLLSGPSNRRGGAKEASNRSFVTYTDRIEQARLPTAEAAFKKTLSKLPSLPDLHLGLKPETLIKTRSHRQGGSSPEESIDNIMPSSIDSSRNSEQNISRIKLRENAPLRSHKEVKQVSSYSMNEVVELNTSKSVKRIVPKQPSSFRQLIFCPDIEKAIFKRHLLMVHSGLIHSKQYLKGLANRPLGIKPISLKEPTNKVNKKTLVLDLDETLIKCCIEPRNHDRIVRAKKDGEIVEIPFKIRPYVSEFLQKLKDHYEIIVFTASARYYAQAIVESLDPDGIISHILDRTHCIETTGGFVIKDLRIIKNRELKDLIIVDNLVHSFGLQIDNGVPILEWDGDKQDKELLYLVDYLIEASRVEDIREFNAERLKLRELANASLPHILIKYWK